MRAILIALVLVYGVIPPAKADRLSDLWDKFHLIEQTSRLDYALETRQWETVVDMFTPIVNLQVLRVRSNVSRERLIERWRSLYFADKDVFHQSTNHIVNLDGDTATVIADGNIWFRLVGTPGGDEWEAWGILRYTFVREGERWLIAEYSFVPEREAGNRLVAMTGDGLVPALADPVEDDADYSSDPEPNTPATQ